MQYLCRKRQKQYMNQLDLFLGFVVLFFALGGLFGGAVRRVIQIAALIIAFREAWRLAPWVESVLGGGDGQSIGGWGFIVPLIAFALIYIGIRLVGNWFSSLTKGTFLSVIDRIVGLVLGLLVGSTLWAMPACSSRASSPRRATTPAAPRPRRHASPPTSTPRLIQSVEDIRHAKALLFGDSDSKTTDSEAPTEAAPASK